MEQDKIVEAINRMNDNLGKKMDNLGKKMDNLGKKMDEMNGNLSYRMYKLEKQMRRQNEISRINPAYKTREGFSEVRSRGNSMDESDLEEIPYWKYKYRG